MSPRRPVPLPKQADTVSLVVAARRLGIGKSLAYTLAREDGQLTEGVKVLRFGTSSRPVFRVPVAQIDAVVAAQTTEAAS